MAQTLNNSSGDTLGLIDQAIQCLNDTGAQSLLTELKERLAGGQFHLAVLGQFKRGKSTLLNALLGQEVLPTAVVPLTAIPTFIRPAEKLKAVIHYADGRAADTFDSWPAESFAQSLARYVTEKENPENRLGVSYVEIFHPAPLLRGGVMLIDTPGIGSTLRHNTETTLNFLPQCDAAVFLVSTDPPITEIELEFLKQVRGKVSRMFFIMNKIDYLAPKERTEALDFLKGVLRDRAGFGDDTLIHCVSARAGLQARLADDEKGWADSGMAAVESYLTDFLARGKSLALCEAVSQKAVNILENELMRLRLAIRSLQLPLDDLQARQAAFGQKIGEIQHEMVIAKDLLRGEKDRMHVFLEEQAESLREKSRGALRLIVRGMLDRAESQSTIRDKLADTVPAFFEQELGETTELFRKKVADALSPHQQRADQLIGAVRQTAATIFDIPYNAPESSQAYALVREPYWVTRSWSLSLNPISTRLIDRFLPGNSRKKRIEKEFMEQVEALVTRNVENLRWETFQSLNRTFDRFATELDDRMGDTIKATQGAIVAAADMRKQQSESTAPETSRLEATVRELDSIKTKLL